jgi:Phytanoyl-CoA dioxygenase (PhyH)
VSSQAEPRSDSAAAAGFVPPQLNAVQRAAVEALRADGIAVFDFRNLFGEELWRDAVADVEPFIRETEEATRNAGDQPAGKDELIIRRLFHDVRVRVEGKKPEKPRFSIREPWLRIAASGLLVDIVNSYRGQLTRLYEVDEWFTVPYPRSGERIASQQWHRDPEDVHVVKVFVYFTDVDDEAGPFEYVRGSAGGGRYADLWPWADGHRYVDAEELEAAVAPEDRLTVTGPAGTTIVCDTGGFHRGGFARTRPRVLSTSTYLPPDTRKRRFKVEYHGEQSSLPPQVRFVLG